MFSSKPKFTPGVPYEVQRVYDLLSPKPKELLRNASNRKYILEGEVGVFNHKERRTKRRYLYLFNDILLITKKEGKKSYWLKIFISLRSNLRVEDVPDSTTKYKVEFRLYAPKKTIILFTSTEEQKLRWIREIRACIEDPTRKNRDDYNPNKEIPDTPLPTPPKEEVKISGDIGKIEIPGVSDNYGDIPDEDDESSGEYETDKPIEIVEQNNKNNFDSYADVPLPPTPNSTPVQDSFFNDFDSIANREIKDNNNPEPMSFPDLPPTPTQQFDPFANSQPLQPVITPTAGSILQPIPSNSAPAPSNTNILQPSSQTNSQGGFDALKSLDMEGNQNNSFEGSFLQQTTPQQMFTQNAMPPPYNPGNAQFNPNLSIEEQMQRLSMNAPNFQ